MISNRFIKTFFPFLLDVLFPRSCAKCGIDGTWLCISCAASIPLPEQKTCPLCEKDGLTGGALCPDCKHVAKIERLLWAGDYHNDYLRHLIHLLKYRFVTSTAPHLAFLIARTFLTATKNDDMPDIIIPVPLHKKREKWRGYNQAALIAKHLSFLLPTHPTVRSDLLVRVRHCATQASKKTATDRFANTENLFIVSPEKISDVANKTILLLDDVATTGATLMACSRPLTHAGAHRIIALTAARQTLS